MAYASGSWVYRDPLTIQKLNQMIENTVRVVGNGIVGCEISVTGTSTVEVSPGSLAIDGSWLTQTDTATLTLTAENANHWFSASGGEGSTTATAWYVVAYNSAGNDFDVKFRLSGPAYCNTVSGTAEGSKLYDKSGTTWMRYIGMVYNNTDVATGALRKQVQCGNFVYYAGRVWVHSGTTNTYTDIDFTGKIPTYSNLVQVNVVVNSLAGYIDFRPDGSTITSGIRETLEAGYYGNLLIPLGENRIVEYVSNQNTDTYIAGYDISRARGN